MTDLSIIMRKSRIFYDIHGQCWVLFHVPENVDIGELSSTLWGEYCRCLKEEISGSVTLETGRPTGQGQDVFSGILG